jgi:multiple sugar transport system substrate-binding protein
LEPATVKGIFSYMHIVLSDLHAPEAIKENTSIVEMQFGTGQFAVFANTTNLIRNMELDSLSGGYSDRILAQDGLYATPFPSGPEGSVPFLGGSNLTIPATHKDNALALELIKTLTTTEQIDHYSRSVGFVPPDTTNWDLWGSKPFYDAAIASLRNARAYPNIPQWGEVEGLLVSTFAEIWTMLDSQFYSPTNYYRILNDYHFKVNQVLGYKSPDQKILSPEQFAVIIQDFREELESGVPVGTVEEPQEGPWYLWALGIGGGALLLAILFLLGKRGGSKA